MDVDLIFLSRDASPPRPDVWDGVRSQRDVRLRVHRVFGERKADDANRWETIARARNTAAGLGSSRWVMMLDDDVVMGPRCVADLVDALQRRPGFAAIGADCAGELNRGFDHPEYPRHVGMASTLFRRDRLATVTFRWEPDKCECQCCCDDLRGSGFGVGYAPEALAWHRPSAPVTAHGPSPTGQAPAARILVAFDRGHYRLFRKRFLPSLRASGNDETVTAFCYDLYPSEVQALAATPGVEVVEAVRDDHPAKLRLRDFQQAVGRWPGDTPVAYWDAGDVIFQGKLGPLWDLVRASPDRLLAAREEVVFRDSPVVRVWAETIDDPECRRRAVDLFMNRQVLNGGFAAGTAGAMLRYLREANGYLRSPALRGSTDWGDQTALNLYCHTNPDSWREIPTAWNFCLVCLGPRHYRVLPGWRIERLDGGPIHVVHGNGGTLKWMDLEHLS